MAELKDINQFISIEVPMIREQSTIPFSLYLHLQLNKRIIHFRAENDEIETGFVDQYTEKKISKFYIHRSQWELYQTYLDQSLSKDNAKNLTNALQILEDIATAGTTTQNVAINPQDGINAGSLTPINPFQSDPQVPPPEPNVPMTDLLKERIKAALKELNSPDLAIRNEAIKTCRGLAKEILLTGESEQSVFAQLWNASQNENGSGHSVNTATFVTLFALATVTDDRQKLKEVALGGLLHDIGLSQIDLDLITQKEQDRNTIQNTTYQGHIALTLQMIADMNLNVPRLTITTIVEHHERFNGTGYPKKKKNWDIDPLSQTLSMADIFDDMVQGLFDGHTYKIEDAFKKLCQIETSTLFPIYYNPDQFKKLVKWIESNIEVTLLNEANQIVTKSVTDAA